MQYFNFVNSGDSSVVRDRDRKVAGSNPWSSGGFIFFPRVNFLC